MKQRQKKILFISLFTVIFLLSATSIPTFYFLRGPLLHPNRKTIEIDDYINSTLFTEILTKLSLSLCIISHIQIIIFTLCTMHGGKVIYKMLLLPCFEPQRTFQFYKVELFRRWRNLRIGVLYTINLSFFFFFIICKNLLSKMVKNWKTQLY